MLIALGGVTEGPAAITRLTAADLAAVAYLAVLVTVVAFVLWYSTVSALGPARAGVLTGIAPVAAAVTGMATGSRAPSVPMWAGMVVVMAGLAAGLWSRPRPAARLRTRTRQQDRAAGPPSGTAPPVHEDALRDPDCLRRAELAQPEVR